MAKAKNSSRPYGGSLPGGRTINSHTSSSSSSTRSSGSSSSAKPSTSSTPKTTSSSGGSAPGSSSYRAGRTITTNGGVQITYDNNGREISRTAPTSSGSSGSSSTPRGTSSGSSYTRPTSGGTSGSTITGSSLQKSSGGSASTTVPAASSSANYHQMAIDAAARGDWTAVNQALNQRQAKINAQGGNDRGTSNADIYKALYAQYGSQTTDYAKQAQDAAARGDWSGVYNSLNARTAKVSAQGGNDRGMSNQDILMDLYSKYGTGTSSSRDMINGTIKSGSATQGGVYPGTGWVDGVDYLAMAKQLAQNGDIDGAQDALMRRGFKLNDTGASGAGISQDQAAAIIQQLYKNSPAAYQTYQRELAANQQNLSKYQSQFGLQSNPDWAYKRFRTSGGMYVYYDGQGRPAFVSNVESGYTPEDIDLRTQYYSGSGDWQELQRQIHNRNVVRTGAGRLIDSAGNYASGDPIPVRGVNDPDTGSKLYQNQDSAYLQSILDRINAGEIFGSLGGTSGGQVSGNPSYYPQGTGNVLGTGGTPTGGQPSGGTGTGSGQTPSGGVDDLSAYLKQLHQAQIAEQLARLKSAYDQNTADLRAQGDRLGLQFDAARNSAAAQGDLSRLSLNEFGAARGLNTGTTGQMALAQNVALQTGLAGIGAQEAQAKSDNDLAISKLGLEYNNAVNQAKAAGDVELAKALYQEYVRQADQLFQQRQLDQQQANWQAQFNYQQLQDALNLSKWQQQFDYQKQQDTLDRTKWQDQFDYQKQQDQLSQQNWLQNFQYGQSTDGRDYAANLAKVMLDNGVMPDSATLSAAGISQDAASAWRNQAMLLLNAKLYGSASSGSGSSKKSSGGGSSSSGSSSSGTTYTPGTAVSGGSAGSAAGLSGSGTSGKAGRGTRTGGSILYGGRTSLDYDLDEDIVTWNGKQYTNGAALADDMDAANLTSAEKAILKKKAEMYRGAIKLDF